MQRQPNTEAGFTVLEVAVASVVTMVGLAFLAGLFTLGIAQNRLVKQYTAATALARQKMEELTSIEQNDARLTVGGGLNVTGDPAMTNYSDTVYINPETGVVSDVNQQGATPICDRYWKIENDPQLTATTVTQGSSTRTLSGVFKDKADPTNIKNGAMLFVDGSINSLRGGVDSSGAKPAIAAQTRLTITANRNIYIDGDLKYANPVVNSDGTPVSNIGSITNVLGIFTNHGNVLLSPTTGHISATGLGLEMNAAVIAFNSNASDDSGAANGIDGSIVYNPTNTAPAAATAGGWSAAACRRRSTALVMSTVTSSSTRAFRAAASRRRSFPAPITNMRRLCRRH